MSRGEAPRIVGTTVDVFALHKDGSEIPIELSLAAWTLGEERYYSGILRDVTMRRWAEQHIEEANEQLAEKNQQLEALSAKLAKYLSRQVYDSIFEGRTEVGVQSYRELLTVFFSDIWGFTDRTDMMEAEPLSELLNEYLSEMSAIANRHGGTLDKFIGDGIMIFSGDPESRGATEDALACASMANPFIADRVTRNVVHAAAGQPVLDLPSVWRFYALFDLVVLLLLAAGAWDVLRGAGRVHGRVQPRHRALGWAGVLVRALCVGALIVIPTSVVGWGGLWTWTPDLAVAIATLTVLLAVAATLRAVGLLRSRRAAGGPVIPATDEDNHDAAPRDRAPHEAIPT